MASTSLSPAFRFFNRFSAVLLVVLAGCAFDYAQDKGADLGDRTERSFKLNSGGKVAIDHDRGSITLDGWEKNEVWVAVVKHYEGDSQYRDQWMRETQVTFDSQPDHLRVRVERPTWHVCFTGCNFHAWVDLTLHVPRHVALEMTVDRNHVRASGLEGDIHIDADRSPIDLRDISGGFHIVSRRGAVAMRDVQAPGGLNVQMERADVEIEGSRLTQGGEVHADRGSVRLRLPESEKLSVEVERDRRSNFHTDFPLQFSGNLSGYGRMRGQINGGGPTLRLSADRGSINLEKTFAKTGKMF